MRTRHELISGRNGYEKWLPTLETASREVFRMMLGTELGRGSPEAWKGAEFTAMVGLAGHLCGLLSVRAEQCGGPRLRRHRRSRQHDRRQLQEQAGWPIPQVYALCSHRDLWCRLQLQITHRHWTTRPVVHISWTSSGSHFGNSQLVPLQIEDFRLKIGTSRGWTLPTT